VTAGFRYRDSSGSADGIRRIDMRAGPPEGEQALIKVRGKGSNLAVGVPGPLVLPVRAVVETSALTGPFPYTWVEQCFEATFGTVVQSNTATRFKARSD
jgi:hypothetical protein